MRFRVYSGPKGSEDMSGLAKEHMLFKECTAWTPRCRGRAIWRRRAGCRC